MHSNSAALSSAPARYDARRALSVYPAWARIVRIAGFLTVACIAAELCGCTIQNQDPDTLVQYPVVAASETRTYAGTVNNNLATGTAYVELHGSDSNTQCRGEGHLLQRSASSCVGGQGECSLQCDDGSVIECRYQLLSCLSGVGLGLSQDRKWFAFSFGPDMSGLPARVAIAKMRDYVAKLPSAVPPKEERKEKGYSTGSGFFVSRDGYVVSAFHVIQDAKEVAVVLRSGDTLPATVKGVDNANDIALLKVARGAKPLPVVSSNAIAVGDQVFTIGYPLIDIEGQEQKTTFGRINALSGVQDDVRFVQIDVPIQPGNSGGPLLDSHGRVVGVVTRTLDPAVLLKRSGIVPQNANYAVKSDYVLPLMGRYEVAPAGARASASGKETELVKGIRDSVVLVVAR